MVLDANVVLGAATSNDGFKPFGRAELVAPPLLWPEARSALHVAVYRRLISEETGARALDILESGPVRERKHRHLGRESWRIADELGWAKTYDAEYLALAKLLDAKLVTFDRRLARAAERLEIATF